MNLKKIDYRLDTIQVNKTEKCVLVILCIFGELITSITLVFTSEQAYFSCTYASSYLCYTISYPEYYSYNKTQKFKKHFQIFNSRLE